VHLDLIGQRVLGSKLTLRVSVEHDAHVQAKRALAHEYSASGLVDVLADGVAAGDHVAVLELHGLGASATDFTGDNNLAALSASVHDKANNAIAGSANSEATKELIPEAFGLCHCRETTGGNFLGIELNGAFGELEALLYNRGEFANAAALLPEHVLRSGGPDDDLCFHGCCTNLHACVAILSELFLQKLV